MAIEQAPSGLGRFEKVVIYSLLSISTIASCISLYFSGYRSNLLEEGRLKLESSMLDLRRESQNQIASLNDLSISIARQEKSENTINQRIKILELIQKAQPSVEITAYKANNTQQLASVGFCLLNKSDFSANVSLEDVEFSAIGPLGEEQQIIQPYLFEPFYSIGLMMPSHARVYSIRFRLKDFARESRGFRMSAKFKVSSPELVTTEIIAISRDLGVEVDTELFTNDLTYHFSFNRGYFSTEFYSECG